MRRVIVTVSATLCFCGAFSAAQAPSSPPDPRVADFLVVDCLLPGQVRRLGNRSTYLSARRAVRTAARDCRIRGGEYVEYDRADLSSALAAWLPQAEAGDREAQDIVGEIYERGLGVAPDYAAALQWYRLAADAGSTRAQISMGYLFENGLGVSPDPRAAVDWYARAAGRPDGILLEAPPVETLPVTPTSPVAPAPPPDTAELDALRARSEQLQREAESLKSAAAQREAELQKLRVELAQSRGTEGELNTALLAKQAEIDGLRAAADRRQQEADAAGSAQSRALEQAQAASAEARARLAEQSRRLAVLEESAKQKLLAGPELTLVDPPLVHTRDIVPVANSQSRERQVIGRVISAAGLTALTVNDSPVQANELGVFSTRLVLGDQDMPVKLVAIDRQGKRSEVTFLLRPPALQADTPPPAAPRARGIPAGVDFGSYHALIIGNNDYQTLPDLATPRNDAAELARVLQQKYGFRTTVLPNATRYQILSALNTLRESLTSNDNLLIYYAGHGELDEVNQRGHWLPVDAERDSTANWIPSTQITDILNIMKARQVLLIADSCYAGALTRSSMTRLGTGMTAAERAHWLRTMATRRSRTVLASGGLAPVMDAGGGQHSVFAKALLEVLESNVELLDGQSLHREVAARVAYAAANLQFDQMPEYAPIRFAGHEAGEFFLLPGS